MKIRELLYGLPLREDDQTPLATPPPSPVIAALHQQNPALAMALARGQPVTPEMMGAPKPMQAASQPPAFFPMAGTAPATNAERYVMNKAQMDAGDMPSPTAQPLRLAGQP